MLNLAQFGQELDFIRKHNVVQTDLVVIDLSTTFADKEIDIPAGATMVGLLATVIDRNGEQQTSSNQRVFIKFNTTSAPGLPFSTWANAGDLNMFAGPIIKLFCTNLAATAGAKLYLLVGVGISVGSGSTGGLNGGSSVAYGGR